MKKNKWIIIRIETKSREFESKMLLAYTLLNEGFSVIVTNKLGKKIDLYPKGIYLINNLSPGINKELSKLNRKGYIIDVLDEEGLVYLSDEQYSTRVDVAAMKLITNFYCYGNDQKRVLTKYFPDFSYKFKITGNPRINLLNNFFSSKYTEEAKELNRKYGDYILFVSNFSLINLKNSGKSREEKREYATRILSDMKAIINLEDFNKRYDYMLSLFNLIVIAILEIAKKYRDTKIIIRPHPSEDTDLWNELTKTYKNILIIKEGNLNKWLKSAKVVLQNSCTSAIESLYLGVPCLSYRPIRSDTYDQPLPNKLSINIFDQETLLKKIDGILCSKLNFTDDYMNLIDNSKDYISFSQKTKSIDKLVFFLENHKLKDQSYSKTIYLLKNFNPIFYVYHIRYLLRKIIENFRFLFNSRLFKKLFSKTSLGFYINKILKDNAKDKYAGINNKTIETELKNINDLFNENNKYRISKIGSDYIIERR